MKSLWFKRFIEAQEFKVKQNVKSSGKRIRHFDIKMFYVKDLVDRGEVSVIYCPIDEMIADYMSKDVGTKFKCMRDLIMNLSDIYHYVFQQECVGKVIKSNYKEMQHVN